MKTLLTFLSIVFLSSAAFAETINLKDGRSVSGKILEKSATEVKIDFNGVPMTYDAQEIKDIDGTPMEAPAPKAVKITKQNALPAIQDDPAEKKTLILKFIDTFGTRRAMISNFETLLKALEEQKPEDAKNIREKFKIDEVIERLIPLYDKHFTSEDLKTYIDFYSSEKGKKLITSIGSIMRESVEVGTDYLKEKFPEIANGQ